MDVALPDPTLFDDTDTGIGSPAEKPLSVRDIEHLERIALLSYLDPEADPAELNGLRRASREAGLVWSILAENLNVYVCRRCIAENVAARGGRSSAVTGNGSAAIRELKNLGLETDRGTSKQAGVAPCPQHASPSNVFSRLSVLLPTNSGKGRLSRTGKQTKKVRDALGAWDALRNVRINRADIAIDHRDGRWDGQEEPIDYNDEDALRLRYQPLSVTSNNNKREKCNRCKVSGERPSDPDGLGFFYAGNRLYDEETGCVGCFFYDPDTWRSRVMLLMQNLGAGYDVAPRIGIGIPGNEYAVTSGDRATCSVCSRQMPKGTHIVWRTSGWAHAYCPPGRKRKTSEELF